MVIWWNEYVAVNRICHQSFVHVPAISHGFLKYFSPSYHKLFTLRVNAVCQLKGFLEATSLFDIGFFLYFGGVGYNDVESVGECFLVHGLEGFSALDDGVAMMA